MAKAKEGWPTNADRAAYGRQVWEAFAAMFPRNDPDEINVQELMDALDTCAECGGHRDMDTDCRTCTCGDKVKPWN